MALPPPSPSALSSGSPAEAWRRVVLLTNPDFTEAELLSLSLPTLQGLLPAYGVRSPVEAAHVELAWRERQRQRAASAGVEAGAGAAAAAAPPISELPPPASVASASVSASPRYGGVGASAAAATEVLVHRQAGEPLGLVFRGDSLLLVGCPDDSPAARCANLGSLVGARLSHVDGRAVRSQDEARALLDRSTAALLGFSPPSDDGGAAGEREHTAVDAGSSEQHPQLYFQPQTPLETFPLRTSLPPSSPFVVSSAVEAEAPAAAAAAAAAATDGGDVGPPPLPYPFNVDGLGGGVPAAVAPGGEASVEAGAAPSEEALLLQRRQRQQQQQRRASSPATLRRAVHPRPFEVPLTPRTAKLSRRRRLATDEPGISDPNVAAALPLEPGGKLCGYGGGGGGGMAWGGGDLCDTDERPPRLAKRPLRTKSPASGNPNASAHASEAAASRQPSGKARSRGEPRPSAIGNPNTMGAPSAEAAAAPATGRYRPPLSELQVHATGNPNVTMGTCDPFAREILEFPRDCNGFYSTINPRGRLPSEPAAHSNPNDAGAQRPAAARLGRRSAASGWDAAEGHGPPGVWPEGGPEDRGAGLRCADAGGGGVMPGAHGWGADDENDAAQQLLPGGATTPAPLGLRFAAPKGGKGAAAAARVEAAEIGGERRRRCPSPDWGTKLSGAGAGVRRTPSAGGTARGRTAGVRNMAAVPTAPADHIGPDWSLSDRSGGGLRFIVSK